VHLLSVIDDNYACRASNFSNLLSTTHTIGQVAEDREIDIVIRKF